MSPLLLVLFALALTAAVVEWLALYKHWTRVEYVAKPAVMICLLAALVLTGGLDGPLLWFGLGLLFSLAGDVLLIATQDRFMAGLVAFLLAHVMYILGFNLPPAPTTPVTLGVAVFIGVSLFPLIRRILQSLHAKGQRKLVLPVQIYATAITLMLLSAMLPLFRTDWLTTPATLVTVGAILFVTSDFILAWHLFVNPIKNGRVINVACYHLGQMALIAGVLGQFTQ
jgi:uncharacterized membrane protein YhhN